MVNQKVLGESEETPTRAGQSGDPEPPSASDSPPDPGSLRVQRKKRKPVVRVIAWGAVLLTAWQVFASFLWIAPYSANAREVVPGNLLTSYMIPFFGQSWSVFAPEPINGDYHFNVRAVIKQDGKEVTTGWVSATDVEISMIRYNLFPPRAGIQSSEVASNYKSAFDALNADQQKLVGGDYSNAEWETALYDKLDEKAAANGNAGASVTSDQMSIYLGQEHMSTAYATQVAKAIWGEGVERVQYRVSRQNVIPFAQRNDPKAERPAPTVILPGWRPLVTEPGQSDQDFADVFRAQYERMSK